MKSPPLDIAELVSAHQTGLWRYLRFLGCDPSLAEDLVQETFLVVLRQPFSDQGAAAAAGYLRTVARRLLIKRGTTLGREITNNELETADAYWVSVAEPDGGDAYIVALRECLQQLESSPRRALELQYEQKQSRSQIAGALGYTEDSIKSLVRRARAALRICIEGKLQHES
ncbi:MAG: RNA polymerase sigma factor [Planctomycetota bacterium]